MWQACQNTYVDEYKCMIHVTLRNTQNLNSVEIFRLGEES